MRFPEITESIIAIVRISVLLFIAFILLAQWLAPDAYHWKQNTVSELAAQGYSKKWVMKIGFMVFGVLLTMAALLRWREHSEWYMHWPIVIYALAIAVSGVFSTAPFIEGQGYSVVESRMHSVCAQVAGIAFSLGLLTHGIAGDATALRVQSFVALAAVATLSGLFGYLEHGVGIVQRTMYLVSYYWLFFVYAKG